jgi:hypothetical protein
MTIRDVLNKRHEQGDKHEIVGSWPIVRRELDAINYDDECATTEKKLAKLERRSREELWRRYDAA